MIELMIAGSSKTGPIGNGPGPQELQYYYEDTVLGNEYGLYGNVSNNDFITPVNFLTSLGMATNTLGSFTPDLWFKFLYNGKVLFIPRTPIANSFSWYYIYSKGALYGDGTYGRYPASTPVLQNATIDIQGYSFRVRVIRGFSSDPFTTFTNGALLPPGAAGSEWIELFGRMSGSNTLIPNEQKWIQYTDAYIGISQQSSKNFWFMETLGSDTLNGVAHYAGFGTYSWGAKTSAITWNGYRPVLELIT